MNSCTNEETLCRVHGILSSKIYNARCNEFLTLTGRACVSVKCTHRRYTHAQSLCAVGIIRGNLRVETPRAFMELLPHPCMRPESDFWSREKEDVEEDTEGKK